MELNNTPSCNDAQPNEMTYNGNHLFHYTTLDSALKIILTHSLRFGAFDNMNDIAEVRREIYDEIDSKTLAPIISEYKAICLTDDSSPCDRGFAIDALWGYYAEHGNGVCLVLDKAKLLDEYNCGLKCSGTPENLQISYTKDFTNAIFGVGKTIDELTKWVEQNIESIFYTKDLCWAHEKEFRLLTKSKEPCSIDVSKSLIGAIICVPNEKSFTDSTQYKLLTALQQNTDFKIYHYSTQIGNKTLCNQENETLWPILGLDYDLDISETDISTN